ncbi:MAG: response regulator transcription factor [Bryobacteraceae bacterium]
MEQKKQSIRILVADHQSLFRQGLLTLIGSEKDLVVLGEAGDYPQLARLAGELAGATPDVTVVAWDLPGLDGVLGLEDLQGMGMQLLVLTAGGNPGYSTAVDSAGVATCITRDEAPALLLPLIRQLARQSPTLSLQNLSSTVERLRSASSAPPVARSGSALTARENEILRLLATGSTVKDAATELDLSVKTVEAHKFNLMRKLNIHSRSELLSYAQDSGILMQPQPVVA